MFLDIYSIFMLARNYLMKNIEADARNFEVGSVSTAL